MATSKGVIQGYVGVAAFDKKHQVIVGAEAHGQGHETDLFIPTVESIKSNLCEPGDPNVLERAQVVADSGFHTEAK